MLKIKSVCIITIVINLLLLLNVDAIASTNQLNAIQIDGNQDGYKISLKTDEPINAVTSIQDQNTINIDLNGMKADSGVSTIFHNTYDIKNVVIKPLAKGNIRITIEGNNISKSKVLIVPKGLEKVSNQEATIILDKPIKEYTSQGVSENIKGKDLEKRDIRNSDLISKIASKINSIDIFSPVFLKFSGILLVTILVINSFWRNKQTDFKIGLSQSLKQKDALLNDSLNVLAKKQPQSLNISNPLRITDNAFKAKNNSLLRNHTGLSAYRNNDLNPYTNNINKFEPIVSNSSSNKFSTNNILLEKKILPNQNSSAYKMRKSNLSKLNTEQKCEDNVTNIDSKKFLESMSKIYESSGRVDLALGLKKSLKKSYQ